MLIESDFLVQRFTKHSVTIVFVWFSQFCICVIITNVFVWLSQSCPLIAYDAKSVSDVVFQQSKVSWLVYRCCAMISPTWDVAKWPEATVKGCKNSAWAAVPENGISRGSREGGGKGPSGKQKPTCHYTKIAHHRPLSYSQTFSTILFTWTRLAPRFLQGKVKRLHSEQPCPVIRRVGAQLEATKRQKVEKVKNNFGQRRSSCDFFGQKWSLVILYNLPPQEIISFCSTNIKMYNMDL